jgi:hypothetical protein
MSMRGEIPGEIPPLGRKCVCVFISHFITAFVGARAVVDGLSTQTLTPSDFVFLILLIVFVIVVLLPPLSPSSCLQTKTTPQQGSPHVLLDVGF